MNAEQRYSHYQRCPVCNGGGWVWGSLYHGLPTTETTGCRTCGGTGIVAAPNDYTVGSPMSQNAGRRSVTVRDFEQLGEAFVTLYLQGLNGVVCDPDAEPGRYGCSSCLGAWKQGKEVLDKHDEGWGNMFRPGAFRVGGKKPER